MTTLPRSSPVDGFSLAYAREGSGPAVILLHGWPGDRRDHRALVPRLAGSAEVVVPDLRGFGESDKHPEPPERAYSAAAQARSVLGLMDELELEAATFAGYDIGSRIAQRIARTAPERVCALVLSPPLPGAGDRVLSADAQREFWYQAFHQLDLVEALVDGDPKAVRAYLRHFWSHWSGPSFEPSDGELDRLVTAYSPAGAFTALDRLVPRRGGDGRDVRRRDRHRDDGPHRRSDHGALAEARPAVPLAWSDRLDEFFADVTLERLADAGHFTPLEAPEAFVAAIEQGLADR